MSVIAGFVIRSSLVLLAGLAAACLLQRQPASLRHWVLAAALALATAQPVITRVMPELRVNVASLDLTAEPEDVAATVQTTTEFRVNPAVPSSASARIDAMQIITNVWLLGIIANLIVLASGMLWLAWRRTRATTAGSEWRDIETHVRSQLGVRRPVRMAITDHPALIVTWGVIRPIVLLPVDADTWSAERKRLVIAHELAHVTRQDWLMRLLAEVARSIHWFNPLFWIACARLRHESEYACDDVVLETGIAGTSYASHLVDLARTLRVHGRTWLPAPSIARPSTLERRVRAMLNPQLRRRPASITLRLALIAMLCGIALPIAAASQALSTPSGTVIDPMGRPLADAVVRLTTIANDDQSYETRTDANGAFQFSPVAPGDYMIAVKYPGFSGGRQRLQLRSGEYTITLKPSVGTLSETISIRGAAGAKEKDGMRYEESAASPAAPAGCTASGAGQLTPPMKIHDVRPRYKQAWIDAGLEGDVIMQARIGVDGNVRSVDVVSGRRVTELEDEAIAAVSQWQFTPTYLNCEPIEVQMFVTASFKIEQ